MNPPQNRVTVYIDGSNLFHKLRESGIENLHNFRFRDFSDWLSRGRPVTSYRYYVGVVRAKPWERKGQALRSEQQRLFANLLKQGFLIERGDIISSGGKYHEKGVDVKLAVDMLVGAYENWYDEAILISSDSDLVPAIKKVNQLGKKVEYIGFSHKPSLAPQKPVALTRLLIREELEPFIHNIAQQSLPVQT